VFPARSIAVLTLAVAISAIGGDSPSSWGELVGNPGLDKWIEVALAEAPSLDVLRAELRGSRRLMRVSICVRGGAATS